MANPHEDLLAKIANSISEFTNSNSTTIYKGIHRDDPTRRRPDISVEKETIEWYPRVQMKIRLKKL